MALTRRILLCGAAGLTLAGCLGTEAPPSLTVSAAGVSGMNPGPDGTDRPLTLSVVQMSATAAFSAADIFALQDPEAALGGEFIGVDQISLVPGQTATATIPIKPGATAIGLIAGFRDPSGKVFRQLVPVPTQPVPLTVNVGPAGISTA